MLVGLVGVGGLEMGDELVKWIKNGKRVEMREKRRKTKR